MAATTIFVPSGYTVATAVDYSSPPMTVIATATDAGGTGRPSATLFGAILFLPKIVSEVVEVNPDVLIQSLGEGDGGNTGTAYYGAVSLTGASITTLTPAEGSTLWIPVTSKLETTVHVNPLKRRLDKASSGFTPQTTNTATTATDTGTSGAATPAQQDSVTSTASSRSSAKDAATTGSPDTTSSTSPSSQHTSSTSLKGAVAGAAIGGVIFGVAACLCIVFCCFRRRWKSRSSVARSSGDETANVQYIPKGEKVEQAATPVTGWQKHLPQEKSDKAVQNTFQTLFEHVQMHVDGFYDNVPSQISNEALAPLRGVSSDGLRDLLLGAEDALPLIEAVLVRWIIHRISLRSPAAESLLPYEFTRMPETYKWHLERDDGGRDVFAGSKRGLAQAFSQWRMLTSFIRSDSQKDGDFKKSLNVTINQAVHTLNHALSPWEIPGKSGTNRMKSLQSILEEASEAGIMLFGQRSLYKFDWSSGSAGGQGSVAVTPAIVKDIDEHGEMLRPARVVIPARSVDV